MHSSDKTDAAKTGVVRKTNGVKVFTSTLEPSAAIRVVQFEEVRAEGTPDLDPPEGDEGPPALDPEALAAMVAEAEERAYLRGLADGKSEWEAEKAALSEVLRAAVQDMEHAFVRTERELAENQIRLALMVAEKILRRQLTADPEAMIASVVEVVQGAESDAGPLRLLCSPEALPTIQRARQTLAERFGVEAFEVDSDPRLTNGDLMLYYGSTTLDARLSTRLSRIERALSRELGVETNEGA